MATRKAFAINTEPHEVVVGGTSLWFVPEANGAEFLQAYARLRAAHDPDNTESDDVDSALAVIAAMRDFIAEFLVIESASVFGSLGLPSRVLVQIVEYLAELYGGGSEERPTTSSSGSAAQRKSPGKRG